MLQRHLLQRRDGDLQAERDAVWLFHAQVRVQVFQRQVRTPSLRLRGLLGDVFELHDVFGALRLRKLGLFQDLWLQADLLRPLANLVVGPDLQNQLVLFFGKLLLHHQQGVPKQVLQVQFVRETDAVPVLPGQGAISPRILRLQRLLHVVSELVLLLPLDRLGDLANVRFRIRL